MELVCEAAGVNRSWQPAGELEIEMDGAPVPEAERGADVVERDGRTFAVWDRGRMVRLVDSAASAAATSSCASPSRGARAYAFSFSTCVDPLRLLSFRVALDELAMNGQVGMKLAPWRLISRASPVTSCSRDPLATQLFGHERVEEVVDVARLGIFDHRFLAVYGGVELPLRLVLVHLQVHPSPPR